jgi:Fur family peroxide stress response transcriptional regulator
MHEEKAAPGVVNTDRFVAICRKNNLKLTPQRLMLYRELAGSHEHPSAEKLYRMAKRHFPSISFDTVNRTLLTFSRIGIVKIVEGKGDPRRFDPNLSEHHHFRCTRCDRIEDIFEPVFDRLEIPPDVGKRFRISGKKVILEGLCPACQER